MPHPILLYDGVCGLCNRMVQFVLRRDRGGVFRFAALQSPFAQRVLLRHGASPQDLDTVYLVVNYALPDEQILARSDAVIFLLKHLGGTTKPRSDHPDQKPGPTPAETHAAGRGLWPMAGLLVQILPRFLRDWGYRIVARNRYRVFGRFDTCVLPSPEHRRLFLDE
jgi:predicted DCC family thiol-disulfide oxidoreductase YuxK